MIYLVTNVCSLAPSCVTFRPEFGIPMNASRVPAECLVWACASIYEAWKNNWKNNGFVYQFDVLDCDTLQVVESFSEEQLKRFAQGGE